MLSDIRMEKVLEAIYEHIVEHMPDEACESCGVLKMLGGSHGGDEEGE